MRAVLDKLISWTGLALAVVLLIAGGLLTWANMFIGDQVKDQLTMQDITMPEGEALAGLRQTLFMGSTLRGLLLYGYAFATIGTIAGYAAIAAFIGAFVLLALVVLGMRHARRTEQVEVRQAQLAPA